MFDNPLVLQAISEVFNERFEAQMKELEGEEPHVFSEKHNKKMAKLIKNQKKPYYALISTAGRRAACIIAAIIILSASALSVRAIREAIFDFIMRIFSDRTVVSTESGTDEGYPETIEELYYISELPEGFEQNKFNENDVSIDTLYVNDEKYILFSQYTKSYYHKTYDNEQSKYKEYCNEENQEYLIFSSEYSNAFLWDNGRYIFTISSNLDKEDILKLCKSTKVK